MPRLKLLTIAVVPALIGMAFVGANAHADVLCKEKLQVVEGVEACSAPYSGSTLVEGSAVEARFVSEELIVTCKSSLGWKNEKDLGVGKAMEGKLESLVFSSCKGTCSSAKAIALPSKALGKPAKEGNGVLAFTAGGKENPGFALTGCFGSMSCSYVAKELPLSFKGGEPAHLETKGISAERISGGSPCPVSVSFSVNYALQQPNAGKLYMAQDVGAISLFPFLPFMGFGEIEAIEIKNTGTVVWTITNITMTNNTNFGVIDPLEATQCKGLTLSGGKSCVVGVECKVINTTASLQVDTGLGTFFDLVTCQ